MTLKEKLELLWKYLLLGVIVFGIFSFSGAKKHSEQIKLIGGPGHEMMFKYNLDDMDMDMDMELGNGDSIIINVNGRVMKGEEALKWKAEHMDDMMDGNVDTDVKKWIDKDGKKKVIITKTINK